MVEYKNTDKITEILTKVLNNNQLKLFHKNAVITRNMIEYILQENDLPNPKKAIIKENCAIIDEKKYYFTDTTWNRFHQVILKRIDITNMEINKKSKSKDSNLKVKLENSLKKIMESNNTTYKQLYKEIIELDNFVIYIHHFLTNYFMISQRKQFEMKRTILCQQLGLCIIRFVIEYMPGLENLFVCFDNQKSIIDLKEKEIKLIIKFATILLKNTASSEEVKLIFEELKVKNNTLQEILYNYIHQILYKEYKTNNIYLKELQDVVENNKKSLDDYDLTASLIKMGDFLIAHLVKEEIFEETFLIEKDKKIHALKPKTEIIEALLGNNSYQKPFLIKNQIIKIKKESKEDRLFNIINENLNRFVHTNSRINIEIKNDSYMKKGKTIYKKYGIYQNYLIFLLEYFLSDPDDILDYACLSAIYELGDFDKITGFLENNAEMAPIYVFLFKELKNFAECKSAVEIFKQLKNIFNYDVITSKYPYNKDLIDWINKIFQRKLMLVSLINDAILLCVFESFIHTTFIDARGRYYVNAASTNIHTHLAAKLIMRLYDKTNQIPPNKEELELIQTHFKFKATQNKMNALINKNYHINYNKETTGKILNYIETFIKPKETQDPNRIFDVVDSLHNPIYDNPVLLLWDLVTVIKKPKRLFYVHSLLFYERERIQEKHPQHLVNHYELDASSSGLQMMSGLFRSIELAKMCNLIIHRDTLDIYSAMTLSFNDTWEELNHFIENILGHVICTNYLKNKQNMIETEKEEILQASGMLDDFFIWVEFDVKRDIKYADLIKTILKKMPKRLFPIKYDQYILKMFDLVDAHDKKLCLSLVENSMYDGYIHEIKGLFILRMGLRLNSMVQKNFNFTMDTIATDRDLFKKAIMTYFYKSTPYGRKDDYQDYFHSRFRLPYTKNIKFVLNELINFLDRFFVNALQKMPDVDLMNQLIAQMNLDKPITISNRNFIIYIEPKIKIQKQIQCPSVGGKRGLQLVIHKLTDKLDKEKMKSMLGANIVHSMDSHIVHLLNELILNININLKSKKHNFRLIHDTNHDCFYLSCPSLLNILIEECYLICFNEDYLNNISGITPHVKEKLQKLSLEEFMAALAPSLHPLFIK